MTTSSYSDIHFKMLGHMGLKWFDAQCAIEASSTNNVYRRTYIVCAALLQVRMT